MFRMARKSKIVRAANVSLLALFFAGSAVSPVHAGVGNDMSDFFDDMGAAANVNGPTAYQGQSAGYYTLGSAWTRFPQKNFQPVNMQLPKVTAGCGGIDIFAGSFSFINMDEFIANLKAIANNSLGFAFQLAIESISPQIAGQIRDLENLVKDVNNFNISSCEAAATAMGSLWPRLDQGESQLCRSIGTTFGKFSDEVRARRNCGNGGERAATLRENNDPVFADQIPTNKNYAWDMINNSPLAGESQEMKELIMNLVGTVIVRARQTNDNSSIIVDHVGAADTALLDGLLDGSQAIRIKGCVDVKDCLQLTDKTVPALGANALKPKVFAIIGGMIANVRNDSPLTDDQIKLLGYSSLPLFKIIAVNEATELNLSPSEQNNLAEVLAVNILSNFAERLLAVAASGNSGNLNNADMEILGRFTDQVNQSRLALDRRLVKLNGQLSLTFAMIDRAMMIESTLQSKLTPGFAASLNYSRSLSAQGVQ